MYYNKEKVQKEMDVGINDPADIVEELYDFINRILYTKNHSHLSSPLELFRSEWEGEINYE